jgi:hypothetical protein
MDMNRFVWAGRAALLSIALVIGTPALAADATLDQVYEAVHAGRLNQAQGMMTDVLRDHPNSAKAHYVEAEILARQGRFSDAQGELKRAEELAPGLPFVSQTSVQELRGLIASAGTRQAPILTRPQQAIAPAAHQATFPWGWLVVLVLGGLVVYSIIRARRNTAAVSAGGAGVGTPAAGMPAAGAPAYGAPPVAPMGGGIGSGIVGGLVTGAAVGAGVVAGEALAHELIGGHASRPDLPRGDEPPPVAQDDLGGQDFGISDSGSWDDGGGMLGGGGGDDWS